MDLVQAILLNMLFVVAFWVIAVRLLVRDVEGEEPDANRCFGLGWFTTFLIGFFMIQPDVLYFWLTEGEYNLRWWTGLGMTGVALLIGGLGSYYETVSLARVWAVAFTFGAFFGLMRTINANLAIGAWTLLVALIASMLMIHYEYAVRLPQKRNKAKGSAQTG